MRFSYHHTIHHRTPVKSLLLLHNLLLSMTSQNTTWKKYSLLENEVEVCNTSSNGKDTIIRRTPGNPNATSPMSMNFLPISIEQIQKLSELSIKSFRIPLPSHYR